MVRVSLRCGAVGRCGAVWRGGASEASSIPRLRGFTSGLLRVSFRETLMAGFRQRNKYELRSSGKCHGRKLHILHISSGIQLSTYK